MSCGCGGADCSCTFIGGEGLTVTGTGTKSNPYVVSAYGGSTLVETLDTPSVLWTETGSGSIDDPYILSANVGTALPPANAQTFTANGTWTKPAGVGTVRVIVQGGGGGGAGGGMQATALTSNFFGALGGAGGSYMYRDFAAADLPATVAITVGAGGTGGAGATAIGAGGNGTAGSASSFGALISMAGGAAGTTVTDPDLLSVAPSGSGLTGLVAGGGGYGGSPLFGSTSTARRVNMSKNPTFHVNTTGWQSDANDTFTLDAIPGSGSSGYMRMAVRAAYVGGIWGFEVRPTTAQRMSVTPGKLYSYSAQVTFNSVIGSKNSALIIGRFLNASGVQVGTQINAKTTNIPAGTWADLKSGGKTAPAGATTLSFTLNLDNGSDGSKWFAAGSTASIRRIMVEQASPGGSYFDGGFTDTVLIDYSWNSTAHNSQSIALTTGGPIAFADGSGGTPVTVAGLAGGTGGTGGGTGTSATLVANGGAGATGAGKTTSMKSGGSGGGGGGAGKTSGLGGNGVDGGGGGGGATGITPVTGAKGGNGGKGFVSVIAW